MHLLSTSEHGVELFEELVGSVGRAVYHWLVLGRAQDDLLPLEEAVEVLPVIVLLLELEAVVELVHFDLLGVVARQNLGVNPPVGQITFWIGDLVRQVERLDPLRHLTGQGQRCLCHTFYKFKV